MTALSPEGAAEFARLSVELLGDPDPEHTLQTIVDRAVATIPGCDYAGMTLRRGKSLETPAASDPLVRRLDNAQYETGQGPCVDAVYVDDLYVVEDTRADRRWPRWLPVAVDEGVLSVLSLRLATPAHVVGGLNLYSRQVYAYTEDHVLTAQIYAQHAGAALAVSSKIQGLQTAMESRHRIGVAQGLLMQRYGLSEDQAFQFLTRVSQDGNTKLRDVAAKLISQATHDHGIK